MSAAPVSENTDRSGTIEKNMSAMNLGDITNGQKSTTYIPSKPLEPPFLAPVASAKPPPAVKLTEDQQAKYEALLEIVKSWKEIPAKEGKGGPITDQERLWLTRECLLRYLRATKWSATEAPKRLMGTLTWRREFGAWDLTGDYISEENETGKQHLMGYDLECRPCHYLSPGRQNTNASHKQVEHLVFMVDRVLDLTLPGQDTLALLINFQTSKTRSNTAPGMGLAREILNILQSHYPERLGRALVINIPWMINGFFKLITPFIDPLTKEKLKFNEDMRQFVPPEQLWSDFNGDNKFEYDHKMYWPALNKTCETRQNEKMERWIAAGKHIGESETYLKGGDVPSIGTPVATEAGTSTVKTENGKATPSGNGHATQPEPNGKSEE